MLISEDCAEKYVRWRIRLNSRITEGSAEDMEYSNQWASKWRMDEVEVRRELSASYVITMQ